MNAIDPCVSGELPDSVVTVADEGLYAVGGAIPADSAISWIPEGLSGWMPVQAYLFRDGGEALLLDGGLAIHAGEIGRGLAPLLAGAAQRRFLVSRWEPDAMINLPWLIRNFGITSVWSIAGLNPLDFFDGFEFAAARSQAAAQAGPATVLPMVPGQILAVGSFRIEVLTTSLRLLLTNWFYEERTRSLFTADSWGFLGNPAGPHPFIARPSPDALAPDVLRHSLARKFDWLEGAYCDALIEDLRRLAASRAIDRICPTFGGIIEGATRVQAVFASTIAALERLAATPRRRALTGFDWSRALSPDAVVAVDRLPAPAVPRTRQFAVSGTTPDTLSAQGDG